MSHSLEPTQIIDELKKQANTILSTVLGSAKLEGFNVGSQGNMPYYWEDPRNLKFNAKTYDWISSNLKADTSPLQLDQNFTNIYIDALSKVSYHLSSDDQEKLNQAKSAATDQQGAVLRAWTEAYGSLPEGEGQPIDEIASIIQTEWADPATTLTDIQNAININELLNKVPAAGKPIVPVFVNWLNAIGDAVSLQNNVTMNDAYLAKALAAAQSPKKGNGGIQLNTPGNDNYFPAYRVNTPTSDIINGLENDDQAVELSMTVSRSTVNEYELSVSGGASFSYPVLGFFSVNAGGSSSYFESNIATTDNETTVKMSFPGVTLVNYGAPSFTKAPLQNWYWMKPIQDAINNKDNDVSGFKFSPAPQIDFSKKGPFGFLTGAAISNYPTVEITVKSADYQRIQKTFEQSASVGISFLGIPLGIGGSESSYSNKVTVDASKSTVTITLKPPKELVAGTATDSVGWVLGVQSDYPAA
ncbi:hypothetical protein OS175_04170 [Marinicella sp. S1101]|uniref:hypothetical protein n=1 Tax=Marinicella marina TaxID=2996016 RepID=UPI002260C62F|nr:hypothetical protein [Marinicella marina]MCX7553063.1 hypothetical protein [Marinicella marina]MDJ1139577.1 hypothetical protein [Marinicella marina]